MHFAFRIIALFALYRCSPPSWPRSSPRSGVGGQTPRPPEQKTREIYVPFSDLHILLESQPKRVMLGRQEYNDLVKRAQRVPETHAPLPALWPRPTIRSPSSSSGPRSTACFPSRAGGRPARPAAGFRRRRHPERQARRSRRPDRRDAAGRLVLFVEGRGEHHLALEMVAPLETTAARQVLNFRLPRPAADSLRLTVPGDVELKSGADVISRAVDKAAGRRASSSCPPRATRRW